jgi:hypothetical protein
LGIDKTNEYNAGRTDAECKAGPRLWRQGFGWFGWFVRRRFARNLSTGTQSEKGSGGCCRQRDELQARREHREGA